MSLPKTSYVKMVDIWLLFTLLIPFLEVFEFPQALIPLVGLAANLH